MRDQAPTNRVPDHPIATQFRDRWSTRAFAADTLTRADMLTLLEAARWAPSASNDQPWRFVWALRGEAGFDGIAAGLATGNAVWATKAAGLIVVASRTTVQRGDEALPNPYHAFDTGAAWAHLGLQAHLMGLSAHAMGGIDRDRLAEVIRLPQDHVIHCAVAVGLRGDPADLPEALRARDVPNQRRPLAEVSHHGTF